MDNPKNSLESFISNPGLRHLGCNILKHLNKKATLSLRSVNHLSKDFVETPKILLKKLNLKNNATVELHEAWMSLIQNIEEQNFKLETNISLILIRLAGDGLRWKQNLCPLKVISLFGDLSLVEFIIKQNMVEKLSKNCESGETPIYIAAENGHTGIVQILIANTDIPNAPNYRGWAPIFIAAAHGHTETVKALIGCTDTPNAPDVNGRTPIYVAASNGHTETVKALIGCTENPNAPDNNGQTPINVAASNGHTEIVKTLMNCTRYPNAYKLLYIAAFYGHIDLVKTLIRYTRNPNAPRYDFT